MAEFQPVVLAYRSKWAGTSSWAYTTGCSQPWLFASSSNRLVPKMWSTWWCE